MVKDRLDELHTKQDAKTDDQSGARSLLNTRVMLLSTKERTGYRPLNVSDGKELTAFLTKCESSTKKVRELRISVYSLTLLHDEILATPNINDKKLTDKKVTLTADIRRLLVELRNEIHNLKKDVLINLCVKAEGSSSRMAALHLQKLTSDLNTEVGNFQSERARFDDKVRGHLKREYEVMGETKTDSELDTLIERGNLSAFCQVDEINETRRMLNETEQRKDEIQTLEKSISEIHDLFLDINMLVQDQGEQLATIEAGVNAAVIHAEAGVEQLKKANDYRKKVRRRKLCIALVVTGAAVIIIVVIAVVLSTG